MFIYEPIFALLFNTSTGRYHPILFRGAPFPGGVDGNRYKSCRHHTKGLDTLPEALEDIKSCTGKIDGRMKYFDQPIPWDGQDIPVMTTIFSEHNLLTSFEEFTKVITSAENSEN